MKSIIKTILSLFLAVSLCRNTKVMASYKIDNFTSNYNFYLNINDGKGLHTIIRSNGKGDLTFELFKNSSLIKSETRKIYEKRLNHPFEDSYKEYYESDDGWSILDLEEEDFVALTCPAKLTKEEEVTVSYFEIQKGINDLYVDQFKLRLADYARLENDLDSAINAMIAAVKFTGTFYIAYPWLVHEVLMLMIDEINNNYELTKMDELYNEMAFFYAELLRDSNE